MSSFKKPDNVRLEGNKIIEKKFENSFAEGVQHYNWKTIATFTDHRTAEFCFQAMTRER